MKTLTLIQIHGVDAPDGSNVFEVSLEPAEDGFIVAECPALPECIADGKDEAEAIHNISNAIVERIGADCKGAHK